MTYQPYSKHNNTPNLQKAKIFGSDPAFLSLFNPYSVHSGQLGYFLTTPGSAIFHILNRCGTLIMK
jgi:hypothetical protein